MAGFFVRKNQRIKRLVPVRYLGDRIIGEGIIKDFSLSGSYITGNVSVSIGAVISLQIFIPGDPEPLLIDCATVKWVKGSDFGVDFDIAQSQVTERIAKIISTLIKTQHGSARNG